MATIQNESVLTNLERETTWSEKAGPEYNNPPSTTFWTKLLKNGIREFGHVAPAGGGWLSGLNDLAIPAGFVRGNVIHKARMLFDASIMDWTTGSRIVCEFDNRVADGKGNNFNFSNQINLSNGSFWQVDPQTGKWTNSVQIAPLAPLTWYDLEFTNFLDLAALKLSFLSLKVRPDGDGNGVTYVAPAVLGKLTPMKDAAGHAWARGANLQVQQCRQTAGVALLYAYDIGMVWQAQ
jgi:hypothetical protein